ncbi:hypothetical protein DFP94_101105 [Fontibacillus phaseoli]|uniref:Uncharacterized protein n=1 Tax=Fontibacillus phaseoli TaxID=1416533 RepID=A0A369BN65_9BACL|nr:hypothetical protein DFP94_101105 [Fontibacillus phaseoli]
MRYDIDCFVPKALKPKRRNEITLLAILGTEAGDVVDRVDSVILSDNRLI